jgi:hypothetical protein
MDSKILTGTALSYLAVYNQDLREEMEECGAFSDSLEEKIALDEAEKWIQKAIKSPGAFTAKAKDHGMDVQEFAAYVDKNPEKFDTRTQRQANLAQTLKGIQNEERAPGVKPYQPKERNPLPKAKPLSGKKGDRTGYGPDEKFKDWTASATPSTVSKTGQTVSQRMDAEKPYGKRMTGPLAREYGSRHAAEVTRVVRGPGEPRAVKLPQEPKKPKMVKKDGKWVKEGYDLYDIILSHLLDEGYAETPEQAEAIMVNMSEEWRDSIIG